MKQCVKVLSLLIAVVFLTTNAMAFTVVGEHIAPEKGKQVFDEKFLATVKGVDQESIESAIEAVKTKNDILSKPGAVKAIAALVLALKEANVKDAGDPIDQAAIDAVNAVLTNKVSDVQNAGELMTAVVNAITTGGVANLLFGESDIITKQYEYAKAQDAGIDQFVYENGAVTVNKLSDEAAAIVQNEVISKLEGTSISKVVVAKGLVGNAGMADGVLYVPAEVFNVLTTESNDIGVLSAKVDVAKALAAEAEGISSINSFAFGTEQKPVAELIKEDPVAFVTNVVAGIFEHETREASGDLAQYETHDAFARAVEQAVGAEGMFDVMNQLAEIEAGAEIVNNVMDTKVAIYVTPAMEAKMTPEQKQSLSAFNLNKVAVLFEADKAKLADYDAAVVLATDTDTDIPAKNGVVAKLSDQFLSEAQASDFVSMLLALVGQAKNASATKELNVTNLAAFGAEFVKTVEALLGPAIQQLAATRMAKIAA